MILFNFFPKLYACCGTAYTLQRRTFTHRMSIPLLGTRCRCQKTQEATESQITFHICIVKYQKLKRCLIQSRKHKSSTKPHHYKICYRCHIGQYIKQDKLPYVWMVCNPRFHSAYSSLPKSFSYRLFSLSFTRKPLIISFVSLKKCPFTTSSMP